MDQGRGKPVSLREHVRERSRVFFVERWFADPGLDRGLVLDLPAGLMRETRALADLGYRVISSDLFLNNRSLKTDKMRWVLSDMTKPLPFRNGTFDYMVNSEGIEHMSDQFTFLQECARVLKPGGVLALTTPNLLSLRARAAFMLAGNRAFKSFVDEETSVWRAEGNRIYHGHAFLINYFQLRYMLHHTGFELKEVVGTHYGYTSLALYPFLAPFVRLFTRAAMRVAKRKNPGSGIYGQISEHVLSAPMLLSKNLFVVAQKRVETACMPVGASDAPQEQEKKAAAV